MMIFCSRKQMRVKKEKEKKELRNVTSLLPLILLCIYASNWLFR